MNIIDWHTGQLDYRCVFLETQINIHGETHPCHIDIEKFGGYSYLRVTSSVYSTEVFLGVVEQMTDSLYHFEIDGTEVMLIIPALRLPSPDEE